MQQTLWQSSYLYSPMLLDSQELNIIFLTATPATGQDRYYYYSPRHTNYHNGNGDPATPSFKAGGAAPGLLPCLENPLVSANGTGKATRK